MVWFKRKLDGIQTSTKDKKETPEGLWYKCPKCQTVVTTEDHTASFFVCERCSFHERIGSEEYFQLFFDNGEYKEIDKELEVFFRTYSFVKAAALKIGRAHV